MEEIKRLRETEETLLGVCAGLANSPQERNEIDKYINMISFQSLMNFWKKCPNFQIELLIVKKIKSSHLFPTEYEEFRKKIRWSPAVFELLDYENSLRIDNDELIKRTEYSLIRSPQVSQLLLFLESSVPSVRRIAEIKSIRTLVGEEKPDIETFMYFYNPNLKGDEKLQDIISGYGIYSTPMPEGKPTPDELIGLSKSNFENVRYLAELNLEHALTQDDCSIDCLAQLFNSDNERLRAISEMRIMRKVIGEEQPNWEIFEEYYQPDESVEYDKVDITEKIAELYEYYSLPIIKESFTVDHLIAMVESRNDTIRGFAKDRLLEFLMNEESLDLNAIKILAYCSNQDVASLARVIIMDRTNDGPDKIVENFGGTSEKLNDDYFTYYIAKNPDCGVGHCKDDDNKELKRRKKGPSHKRPKRMKGNKK